MTQTDALVLFDIDGTLVQTAHAGVRGMNAAFGRLHGRHDALAGVPIAGRTDRSIVREAFTRFGVEATDRQIDALRAAYLDDLRVEISRPTREPMGVLPGVLSLIDAFEGYPSIGIGLLTGNFQGGAAIKLGHFGLWRRFRFGAFGDGHENRRDLLPLALESARAAGLSAIPTDRVIVIGDTPLDVDCAAAHGARALAVATGTYDADALVAAGADLTVATLEDTGQLVEWTEAVLALGR